MLKSGIELRGKDPFLKHRSGFANPTAKTFLLGILSSIVDTKQCRIRCIMDCVFVERRMTLMDIWLNI